MKKLGLVAIMAAICCGSVARASVYDLNQCSNLARPEPYISCADAQELEQMAAMQGSIARIIQLLTTNTAVASMDGGMAAVQSSQVRFLEYRDAQCGIIDAAFQTLGIGSSIPCRLQKNIERIKELDALEREFRQ